MSEHVTALFVGGLYYWFAKRDRQAADLCWRTGADVLSMPQALVIRKFQRVRRD